MARQSSQRLWCCPHAISVQRLIMCCDVSCAPQDPRLRSCPPPLYASALKDRSGEVTSHAAQAPALQEWLVIATAGIGLPVVVAYRSRTRTCSGAARSMRSKPWPSRSARRRNAIVTATNAPTSAYGAIAAYAEGVDGPPPAQSLARPRPAACG